MNIQKKLYIFILAIQTFNCSSSWLNIGCDLYCYAILYELEAILEPPSITYNSYSPLIFTKNVNTSYTPEIKKITPTEGAFTIAPDFPTSLYLDNSTGIISGTPTQAQTKSTYRVQYENAGTILESNRFYILVQESSESGICNTTGIFPGCNSEQPYSCSDAVQPTYCYRELSHCQQDIYCY
ncbi:Ig domain-containing protein [Leptospira interrogans]|uniref:Ig domain-containing protein n=1 Tax=Leptospira interrogans TaxID=173 RepID=UPI0007732ABE|nr:Ig domain-containing protein [Leptospira interrogans]